MDNILESLKDARKLILENILISEGDDSELAKKAFDFMKQKSDKFTQEGWQEAVDAKRGIGIPLSKWISVEKLVKQMFGTVKEEDELDEATKPKKLDWGFDLTDISAEKWSELVKLLGLKCMLTDTRWAQKSNPSKWWEWKGKGIIINTSNNPITGREANRRREDEKGYAGYIGITGDDELVMKAKTFIKNNASEIKDESKKERSYI